MDDRLVIFRGAETLADVGRYDVDPLDAAYEEALKICRKERHNVFSFFVDGREVLVCGRCNGRWIEE